MNQERPILTAGVWIGYALGGLLSLFFVARGIQLRLDSAMIFALIAVGFGVVAAAESTYLNAAVRHTWNLHYAAVIGTVSVVWTVPMVALAGEGFWRTVAYAGLLAAGPWTLAHIVTNVTGGRRRAPLVAAAASLVGVALW